MSTGNDAHLAQPPSYLHNYTLWHAHRLQLKATPSHRLSTALVEDPHNIAEYCSFLVARAVVTSTLSKHVTGLRKLVAWRASLGQEATNHARLQAVLQWIDTLHKQCPNATLPPRSALMRTNLPHAREFLALQLKVEAVADKLMAEDIQLYGVMKRSKTAMACQDAALLAMMAGYLPPPRLAALRSTCHPDHILQIGGCMDEDCR